MSISIYAQIPDAYDYVTFEKNTGAVYMPYVYGHAVTGRDLYISSTGKLGYLSSAERFKKNITDMEDVNWLYKLRPVNFIYKTDETNTKQYGLIAEEVEKINKLFVSYDKDGVIENVYYSKLISPIVKVLKE